LRACCRHPITTAASLKQNWVPSGNLKTTVKSRSHRARRAARHRAARRAARLRSVVPKAAIFDTRLAPHEKFVGARRPLREYIASCAACISAAIVYGVWFVGHAVAAAILSGVELSNQAYIIELSVRYASAAGAWKRVGRRRRPVRNI